MADFDGVIFDMDGTLVVSPLDFVAIRAELGIAPGNGILEEIQAKVDEEWERLLRDEACS